MAIPNDGAGFGSANEQSLGRKDLATANFLLSYLRSTCAGEENAKTVTELATQCQCSARKVRTLVTYLRQNRQPILATPNAGYFWPRNRAEADHTIAFLTQRIASTMSVRNGIELGLADLFPDVDHGQMELLAS